MNIKGPSLTPLVIGQPNGQHNSHTKIDSEFEKNAIGCTTFVVVGS